MVIDRFQIYCQKSYFEQKYIYINNFLLYMFPSFDFNLRITYKNILNKIFLMFRIDLIIFFFN